MIMSKQTFKHFVQKSNLDSEDKQMWSVIISSLDPVKLDDIIAFIDNDLDRLHMATENIKLKKKAFETNDKTSMNKILNRELELTKEDE